MTGSVVEWNSRWHRKQRRHDPARRRDLSWWLAILFLIGSTLFVVGGVAAISGLGRAGAWMNLLGSICFSIGAGLALVEAATAARRLGEDRDIAGLWSTAGGRAALTQFVAAAGFFQIAMAASMAASLEWIATDFWIWTPSTIGSIGFVTSGVIFTREARPAADIGFASARANLGGSICFLTGSLLGYLAQGPTAFPHADVATPVFLAGSLLFLLGSALGIVELHRPLEPHQWASPPNNGPSRLVSGPLA
jgi:hypothetical protein